VITAPLLLAPLLTVTLVTAPEAPADTVGWAPCEQNERAECGSVTVPVDWTRPDGERFDHLDSTNAARDVDALRAALGEPELNLYALSYGTVIGQMYAEQYPDRIRTMVLDAVYDHSVDSDRFALTGARAAQESFDQFVEWCEDTPECAVHGRDIRRVVADLFDRAERGS
jgi:pimeloyl-ACP methyl ester carboxylesterase